MYVRVQITLFLIVLLFQLSYIIVFRCSGLLTVEPLQRLRMSDLQTNSWLQGCDVSSAPLMTPDVLTGSTPRSAEHAVASAFNAFHKATRQGFRLQVIIIK